MLLVISPIYFFTMQYIRCSHHPKTRQAIISFGNYNQWKGKYTPYMPKGFEAVLIILMILNPISRNLHCESLKTAM